MTKYHISKKGAPQVCSAQISCRLKGEHYDSKDEATKAYEEEMMQSTFEEPDTKKLSSKDFTEIATSSTHGKELMNVAINGTDNARKALGRNPATPTEVIEKAYIAAKSDSARIILSQHLNADWRIMHPDHVAQGLLHHLAISSKDSGAKSKPHRDKIKKEINSLHVDDKTLEALEKNAANAKGFSASWSKKQIELESSRLINKAIENPANIISQSYRKEKAANNPRLQALLIEQGGVYTLKEFKEMLPNISSIGETNNKKYIDATVEAATTPKGDLTKKMDYAAMVVKNRHSTSKQLETLWDSVTPIPEREVYNHPKASKELKRKIELQSIPVQSDLRLKKAVGKNSENDFRNKLILSKENNDNVRGWHETKIQLDKKAIEQHGLTPYDVENLFHKVGGSYTAYKYNADTGFFGGSFDSSD